MPLDPTQDSIRFGDCTLEVSARQLRRAGTVVPLEPKMYELLHILIERWPAVVKNEELDELLWPKVYVARTSLTRLVSELRTLLGDDAREPRIIRTVYKGGYAFCAPLSRASPGTSASRARLHWGERQLEIPEGESVVGREEGVALVIDDDTVSRRHARLHNAGGLVTITDLGSRNGTQVGGETISASTQLTDGDEVMLGSAVVRFRVRKPPAETVVGGPQRKSPR